MLTDQQLTETAVKLIAAELDRLAYHDHNKQIGDGLCYHHCASSACFHDATESAREIHTVHRKIKDMVAPLRSELARHATDRGITLPEPTRQH